MVLTTRSRRPANLVSRDSIFVPIEDADMDANSLIVVKIHNVPIQTTMNPYTSPAGPPLGGLD